MRNAILLLAALTFTSTAAVAHTLSIDFQNADIKIKGDFSFQPGSPLIITGVDRSGKRYAMELTAKKQKDDLVQLEYKLNHSGKLGSGSMLTKLGANAKLESGVTGKEPNVIFEAKLVE